MEDEEMNEILDEPVAEQEQFSSHEEFLREQRNKSSRVENSFKGLAVN